MIKASALYLVIIIALVIGLLCSFLVFSAYYFRLNALYDFRYQALQRNVESGTNILLSTSDSSYFNEKRLSLYGETGDSVALKRSFWGAWDANAVTAFNGKDKIYRAFFSAHPVDSTKWYAIYLQDQDSPLSISGETSIVGRAALPVAGIRDAYIENKKYTGEKKLISGEVSTSQKVMPEIDNNRLAYLYHLVTTRSKPLTALPADTIKNSFNERTKIFDFGDQPALIKNCHIAGNIILRSDSTITIDSSAHIHQAIIYAHSIRVRTGFKGSCQLYAKDKIWIEKNCVFEYPSVAAITRFDQATPSGTTSRIKLDSGIVFSGLIFNYEKSSSPIRPTIELEKDIRLQGGLFVTGNLICRGKLSISGSLYASKVAFRNNISFYDSYLVDAKINSLALHPAYLTSSFMPYCKPQRKLLQWLEKN